MHVPRGIRPSRIASGAMIAGLALLTHPAAAGVEDFRVVRWGSGAGADGRTYALVTSMAEWSWHDAQALAVSCGGRLTATPSPQALAFVIGIPTLPGAFDCSGPWLGGQRSPDGTWRWIGTGDDIVPFAWAAGRPAQASAFEAVMCLGGDGQPEGTWVDALPSPDSGTHTRSAVLVWDSFEDCDEDGLPDALEIAREPSLDSDGDGELDACRAPSPDLNGDGVVNGDDLGLLLAAWGAGTGPADLNLDGAVDGNDLGLLLAAWTL
jgi:hypothetical protein